jgi:hypothetical protein
MKKLNIYLNYIIIKIDNNYKLYFYTNDANRPSLVTHARNWRPFTIRQQTVRGVRSALTPFYAFAEAGSGISRCYNAMHAKQQGMYSL